MFKVWKFTVQATRDGQRDTSKHYIAAYAYEHALSDLRYRITSAGWTIEKITLREIFILDIRDKCDQITYDIP